VSSSGAKVPSSRIFRERAEEYRALADSFRTEQMRALLLSVAADYDRMADRRQRLNLKMQTTPHEAVTGTTQTDKPATQPDQDCVLYVPPGVFVGHDALDKFAGDLRATHPHFVYTPHGEPQALHNGGILAWGSGPKGEAPDYTGLDVVIVHDGKIAALYVFLNPKFA
jgi:hypothetical protein